MCMPCHVAAAPRRSPQDLLLCTWQGTHKRAPLMCAPAPAAPQAPLFGMQSWVNSQEVRQWLQTQIASEPLPSMRGPLSGLEAYGSAMSRHNSEAALPSAGADVVSGPVQDPSF